MALTASSTVPKAVSMMTSTSGATALTSRRSSRPVSPGILRSDRTRSTPPARNRSSAAWPSGASATWYPARVSVRSRLWRIAGSSSATSSIAGSDMLGPLDRKRDGEGGARADDATPADAAAVLLHDLAGDGEPESGALRLGGEELLEQPLADLERDARTGVAHPDLHGVVEAPCGRGEHPALGESLEPVLDEIDHGLAQHRAVDGHGRHGRVCLEAHGDALARGQWAHELRHRRDHLVDGVLLELRAREAGEGEVLLRESVQRRHLLADGGQEARGLVHLGSLVLAPDVAQPLGVQLDGGDGVAHLVRDLQRE